MKGGAGPLSCYTIQWDGVSDRLYYNVVGEDAYSILCLECLKGGCVCHRSTPLDTGVPTLKGGVCHCSSMWFIGSVSLLLSSIPAYPSLA